ncbi:nucleotide exchange factor GrpE [Fructobacillus sp. M2-14]|uniref:Protein GrpE n=1 Tax=Fructobacillus broussonetiae TaxID=2713173 RepID=A0ABS5QY81_9LACO|nr:nucleotide exchange factor GrpE [Fructobacillus broussonetiae]MBS9338066.1 nucleotide exchange factor GrpE [Fructobacillus broussonetiae]
MDNKKETSVSKKDQEKVEEQEVVDEAVTEDATKNADAKAEEAKEKDQVAELKEALEKKDDELLRAQAEIQNIQTRNAREIANIRKYDGQKLAESILPVVDNLERALAVETDGDDKVAQIHKGVEITLKTMKAALTEHGIEEVGKVGDDFDPNTMQGVQSVPAEGDVKADQVAAVLQKGYKLQDRVIRPAMVAVAQ